MYPFPTVKVLDVLELCRLNVVLFFTVKNPSVSVGTFVTVIVVPELNNSMSVAAGVVLTGDQFPDVVHDPFPPTHVYFD